MAAPAIITSCAGIAVVIEFHEATMRTGCPAVSGRASCWLHVAALDQGLGERQSAPRADRLNGGLAMALTRMAHRAVSAITATAVVLAAGCSSGPKGGPSTGTEQAGSPRSPVTTTDADWKPVADTLGRTGKLGDNNTAYRVNLPRNDLQVT